MSAYEIDDRTTQKFSDELQPNRQILVKVNRKPQQCLKYSSTTGVFTTNTRITCISKSWLKVQQGMTLRFLQAYMSRNSS